MVLFKREMEITSFKQVWMESSLLLFQGCVWQLGVENRGCRFCSQRNRRGDGDALLLTGPHCSPGTVLGPRSASSDAISPRKELLSPLHR